MSLLSGMNDMLTNKAALEAAQDMFDFDEDLALEADELIDTMIDGMDDIDAMEAELEEEDEINDELESEDNFTDTVGDSANESAALTGTAFLSSLILDTDDPIKTKDGSVGSEDGTATHKDNFSAEADDNNDPIKTKDGSVGSDGSANPDNNFTNASKDTTDPIKTEDGSVGQDNSTAKDPAVESAMFFAELLGNDVAMEGLINRLKEKSAAKKSAKRLEKLKKLGISQDLDNAKLADLLANGKHDEAKRMVVAFGKKIEAAKAKVADTDPEAETKRKIADQLIKTNSCILIGVDADSTAKKLEKDGVDKKTAKAQTIKIMKNKEKDPAVESYINECIDMLIAYEASVDPEATEDGSVGQDNSKASFDGNFSDGKIDDNDPVKTKDGAAGQDDSAATFSENFSDGKSDTDDPIKTEDGSVGQDDSTAKDPAVESTIDELEKLNSLLLDDFDDDDDDID